MTLGEYVKQRRTGLGISRNMLATRAGISHTEVHRIEIGERTNPSMKVLTALAISLEVPQEEMLRAAGLLNNEVISPIEQAFPGLTTEKQKETVSRIAENLNSEAAYFMFINYSGVQHPGNLMKKKYRRTGSCR